jgi:hypothetical protein
LKFISISLHLSDCKWSQLRSNSLPGPLTPEILTRIEASELPLPLSLEAHPSDTISRMETPSKQSQSTPSQLSVPPFVSVHKSRTNLSLLFFFSESHYLYDVQKRWTSWFSDDKKNDTSSSSTQHPVKIVQSAPSKYYFFIIVTICLFSTLNFFLSFLQLEF